MSDRDSYGYGSANAHQIQELKARVSDLEMAIVLKDKELNRLMDAVEKLVEASANYAKVNMIKSKFSHFVEDLKDK